MKFRLIPARSSSCFALAFFLGWISGHAANSGEILVGSAYADITPTRPMPNYNGQMVRPDAGATPLRVNVLVCADAEKRVVLLSVDCTFLGRAEVLRLRDALRWRIGVAPDHVAVAATHSHAAPATTASFLSGALPDPQYVDFVVERATQAAASAAALLRPARLAAASVPAPPFASSRRRISPAGQAYMTGAEPDSSFPGENPIEEELQYVMFEDAAGRPLAGIFAVACHNNMVGGVYSGDFFGRAADALRARLGDIGLVALAAPCGDVNFILPGRRRLFPDDRATGEALADVILKSLAHAPRREPGPLATRAIVQRIPDRPYDPAEFVYDNGRGEGPAALASFQARYTPEEKAVRERGATGYDVEIQAITLGSLAIVTNPAELFSIYGRNIRQASPFAVTLVSSLTNGYCGYVPTPGSFAHRGYETYRSVYTSRLAKDAGDQIEKLSIGLLRQMATP
jgi:neutral ceramidase